VLPDQGRLSRGDESVHLEPKAMDLLVFLMERPGDVLSRETIIDAVWSDSVVGEAVLRSAIAALRRALHDDAHDPRLIETIPKRGYRLIAPVKRVGGGSSAAEGPPSPTGPRLMEQHFSCALRWGMDDVDLAEGESIIGRTPESTVQIACERVSRRHARIVVANGRATIEDLGSKNGTFVDGRRIDVPTELVDGQRISVGPIELEYRGLTTAETETDEVGWYDSTRD
jgi:DNA-binding winged helix-turn-helix (wHTH) protein